MREVRFRRLAVMLHRPDAAAERNPYDHGHTDVPERPEPHLGELADDLVGRREDETVELDLTHRAIAAQRQADRGAHDPRLGERSVDHPALPEILLQPVCHTEDAAELADVLT